MPLRAKKIHSSSESIISEVKVTQSCPTLRGPQELYSPWNSPDQDTAVGSLSLLQGIFPTQGSNPGLPHCTRILHQLSHKGNCNTKMYRENFKTQVWF